MTALPAVRHRSIVLVRLGGLFLLLGSLDAWTVLIVYGISRTTVDPAGSEFGPSFDLALLAIALSAFWRVFAVIGFIFLWLWRARAVWNLPFLAVALGFGLIAVQSLTNEPIRDLLAYIAFTLLALGGVFGALFLVRKRPLGLAACFILALFLLTQAVTAVLSFGLVGSPDETSISYGPSLWLGWCLALPAIALLQWSRRRGTSAAGEEIRSAT